MLRTRLSEALKVAMKAKEARRVSTLRLILAALKDRDIAARTEGKAEGLSDDDILHMLVTMVRQRKDAIALYEKGGRQELAQQEREEITVIEGYLPRQLGEAEAAEVSKQMIAELGATGLKDMGRTMAALKARYAGRMDLARTSDLVKQLLTGPSAS